MDIEFKKGSDYLTVRLGGEWIAQDAIDAIKEMRLKLEESSMSKLLMDLTELSAPKANIIRFHSGAKISEILFDCKIAGFSQPEKVNRLGETSARNRGANFKMFTSENEAVTWLVEGK